MLALTERLRDIDIYFRGDNTSEMRSTLKRKSLFPIAIKFFPFRIVPFSEEVWCHKNFSLLKMAKFYRVYPGLFGVAEIASGQGLTKAGLRSVNPHHENMPI